MQSTILYDEDCGFCRTLLAAFLAWDRHSALRPVPIGSEEGARLLAGLSPQERDASWHLVEPDGGRRSAGAAAAPLLRKLPGGMPFAAAAEAAPQATAAAYRWIARNRTSLGSPIPASIKARADRRIERRSATS